MRKLSAMLLTLGSALSLAVTPALTASAAVGGSAQVTATGSVVNVSGKAAAGAVVDLYAWPSDTVLQHLRPGEAVPRTLLAAVTTNAAGGYSFRVSPAALRSAAVSSGTADLEADSGTASWFFSQKTTGVISVVHVRPLTASPATCSGWVFQHQVKKAWGIVGQAYVWSKATHVHVSFNYGRGQSTTLGVGVSPTAKFGTFTASGSESQSKTSSEKFPGFSRGNQLWETLWRMALYQDHCSRGGKAVPRAARSGFHCVKGVCYKYQIRSDGWASGDKELHPRTAPHTPSFNCVPYNHDGGFSTADEKAITWSGGLTVSAVGFHAEAQTGYDKSAQLSFSFGAHRELCGTNGVPPNAAQLVAEKR